MKTLLFSCLCCGFLSCSSSIPSVRAPSSTTAPQEYPLKPNMDIATQSQEDQKRLIQFADKNNLVSISIFCLSLDK